MDGRPLARRRGLQASSVLPSTFDRITPLLSNWTPMCLFCPGALCTPPWPDVAVRTHPVTGACTRAWYCPPVPCGCFSPILLFEWAPLCLPQGPARELGTARYLWAQHDQRVADAREWRGYKALCPYYPTLTTAGRGAGWCTWVGEGTRRCVHTATPLYRSPVSPPPLQYPRCLQSSEILHDGDLES